MFGAECNNDPSPVMISRQFKIKNNDTWKEIKIRKKAVDIYPFTLGIALQKRRRRRRRRFKTFW
jgi:hypothetical protein